MYFASLGITPRPPALVPRLIGLTTLANAAFWSPHHAVLIYTIRYRSLSLSLSLSHFILQVAVERCLAVEGERQHNIKYYNSLKMPHLDYQLHACKEWRNQPVFHDVLLDSPIDGSVWVRLTHLISVTTVPSVAHPGGRTRGLFVGRVYNYADVDAKLDMRVLCPSLAVGLDSAYVAVTHICQRISLLPQPGGSRFWLDWWQVRGPCAYPDENRRSVLSLPM